MLGVNSVPTNLKISCQNPPMNLLSLSLTIDYGNKCNQNKSMNKKFSTCAAEYLEGMEKNVQTS
jgi:hypothetical protein